MNNKTIISIIVFVLFVALIVWVQSQTSKITKEEEPAPVVATSVVQEAPKKIPVGEVVRRTRVQRASDYIENIFYVGDEVIARQMVYADGRMDQEGKIPNGPVKFFDEYQQTYGVEYYYDGKKHGTIKTYSQDGTLKSEAEYVYGQLVKNKEYYSSGLVRFEFDSSDAIISGDQREVGIGKLYYPDGKLKYEWNLTRTNKGGYKRSYNQDGTLRAESFFDENGQFLKENRPAIVVEEPIQPSQPAQ